MIGRDNSDDTETWLLNLPPTSRHRWSAVVAASALLIGFGALAPFASMPLPKIDAFVPVVDATIFFADLITAVLLFAHFSVSRSRALLVLASGYLFTALIVIPHALTFPGAFSPGGLLGAGVQSTAWIWIFWHAGFPVALLGYVLLKNAQRQRIDLQYSPIRTIGWSVAIVFVLVCGLTLLAVAGDKLLPQVFLDRTRANPVVNYILMFMAVICAIAPALLWSRRQSVLDLWLMVVGWALVLEFAFTGLFMDGRFNLGFYATRVFSLVTATVVLVILVAETTRLYARLARANMLLQRERNNKLMNLEAMAASFSHEMKQPLAAIAANGGAALRWLDHTPPNVGEARSALNGMVDTSHRASHIFDNLRVLFGKSGQEKEPVDVNEVAREALSILQGDLRDHEITASTEFARELPLVMGHKGQLQEVIINLINNRRILKLKTTQHDGKIIASVQDSGPGIDPKRSETIFDAFVTTKPNGTGLGLAICRMIMDDHGGQLLALPSTSRGAVFQVVLPATPSH
jgi:signal transduction histidine kinase